MRFEDVSDLLKPGYLPLESGVTGFDDVKKTVAALTRMPGCKAKMVHWWFGWTDRANKTARRLHQHATEESGDVNLQDPETTWRTDQ